MTNAQQSLMNEQFHVTIEDGLTIYTPVDDLEVALMEALEDGTASSDAIGGA